MSLEDLREVKAAPTETVADQRAPTVSPTRRQRRPTGKPPPLPRKIGLSAKIWLALTVYLLVASFVFSLFPPFLRLSDHINTWLLLRLADLRTGWLTRIADGIKIVGSGWGVTVLGLGEVALLMIFRRWRHLLVFLGSIFVLEQVGGLVYGTLAIPRPYGVRIIGGWGGYSTPSPPVALLTVVLVGITYTLVVPGRARWYAKLGLLGIVFLFALSRLYLAVDRPADVVFGVVLGMAIAVTAFRWFTPNEFFPVNYRKGKTAHLDVTGARGMAIRQAVQDQLGMKIVEVKPVGLEASGGSTPLRLRVEGNPDTYVFAKLYAKGHVRADRWYKLWRTILYGTLEDEAPFQTVRRFVEYEDYTLRLMHDAGIPVPIPLGIVEITPEREYMLVMEFFEGASEISDAPVDDHVIDQALVLVRKLWDAGLAHRDIKPANLMVRDGELRLIDVFFVQVRPSPWRQAVDLANMLLVLAVRTDPERVYRKALAYFTPEEIAEAFAATRGVASPTQLRSFMKRDGRDLLAQFRKLAPERRPIVIQRWSVRRVAVAVAVIGTIAILTVGGIRAFFPAQNLGANAPDCGTNSTMILMAQSVPSAASLPCIASLPSGWRFGGGDIRNGRASFWLDSDRAGTRAVTVTLTRDCDTSGAEEIPSDEAGATRFERPDSLLPRFTGTRFYRFPGACAAYRFSFARGASPTLSFDADVALTFMPRSTLVKYVERREGQVLCGRERSCPG
jgi:tRNA A-37 threonylcarbamoyl transferase component Bud32/membrane-associated phospholipid phosphatase